MATPLLKLLSNAKTRTLVLLIGGVLAGGIIIAIVSSGKSGNSSEKRVSKTTEVPKGVESTPGAKTSEKYRELQEKANTIGSDKAEKKGSTFIPTIVADKKPSANEDLQSQFLKALGQADGTNAANAAKMKKDPSQMQQDPRLSQLLAQQKQDDAAADALARQRQAQLNADKMAALNEQRLKAIETVAQAMEEQGKAAFNAWNDVPLQVYNIGEWEQNKKQSDSISSEGSDTVDTRPVVLKAGTILFATLETSVNSDEPGPIMAKIVQPPFKDSKLIGKIELPQGDGEKVTLHFDTLSIPTEPNSSKINAVAIDPDTARTALATDVDHHYLLRWGTLFGSAFLAGYSKAVSQNGTTVTQQSVPGQATVTTANAPLSGRQQIFEGLGQVGSKWGEQMGQQFSRKPTITIAPGTGVGILILADVKLGLEPKQKETQQAQTSTTEQQKQSGNSMDLLSAIVQNAANTKANTTNNQAPAQNTTEATKKESTYNTSKQETK